MIAPRSAGAATRGPARRLTDEDRSLRAITEAQLQNAVIDLARSLGWGVTQSAAKAIAKEAEQYGVETPPLDGLVFHPRYSLGSEPGWPDLTLVRRRDRRLVFAELKAEKGVVSPRQAEVLGLLEELAGGYFTATGKAGLLLQVHIWRPSDLADGSIAEVLR